MQADSPRVLCQQAYAFALLDRPADAIACIKRAMRNPDVTGYTRSALTAARIYTNARSGRRSTAEALVAEFEIHAADSMHVAEAFAGLSDGPKAVEP